MKLNFMIVIGLAFIAVFLANATVVSASDTGVVTRRYVCGMMVTGGIDVPSDMVQTVQFGCGYGLTPLITARLKNGDTVVIASAWRIYNVRAICAKMNDALRGCPCVFIIYPYWWALLFGGVLIFLGVAKSLGVIHIISEEEWREKYDLLNLWTRIKKDWKSDEY